MEPNSREIFEFSEEDEASFGAPKIVVVGCGGAGNNTVSCLVRIGLEGARTVAINTDRQHLKMVEADKKILMGGKLTGGLGTGGDPEVGRKAAEQAVTKLEDLLDGADMVFVTAGMGGGTGTGSAPVVARLAKEKGAIVVAMVTTPFHMERARVLVAEEGLEALRAWADTLIVLDNNRLLDHAPDLPLEKAFSVVDQIIAGIIQGLIETLTQPSQINLDFADVRTIMSTGGASFIFVGEGSVRKGPEKIVRSALKNPMLEVDCRGAKACLLHMTGGPDLTLKEAAAIAGALTQELDPKANVIWGARIRPDFEGRVRLMAIITGVKSAQVLEPSESGLKETPAREEHLDREKYARIEVIK
jgi:cell division protein FtsZ